MKKLIFILLMALAFACVMPAWDAAYPSGVISLEAVLSGDGADILAVIPDTVLVSAMPYTVEPSSFQAVWNDSAIRPQSGIMSISGMSLNYRQAQAVSAADDYHLRC